MRIGIVTGEYPPMVGGVGAFSQILAGELLKQAHDVSIFSSREATSSDAGIHLHTDVKIWNLASLFAIRAWSKVEQLDIINLQFQTAAFGMSPWIHFLPDVTGNIPVVTTFHDLRFPYLFPKAGKVRDWIVMHLAKASNGVIVTNHEDQTRLRQLSNTSLIPIGSNILDDLPANIDTSAWRNKVGAQNSDFLLAYFGLFNRSKGLEILLQSLTQLRADGIPAKLVMIGGGAGTSDPTNQTFMNEINRQIETHELAAFVRQTGFLADAEVSAYLAVSDVVVQPFTDGASYRRGSLMAAIHYGRAIVTTTPQVPVPAFKDGENMLLVKPGDPDTLTSALKRIYESRELRQKLQNGAKTLAKEFEWPKIARATTDFYRRVIEESTSA